MAGIKSLIGLALAGSAGMTLLILACTLGEKQNWWPAVVTVFYLIVPFPILISKQLSNDGGGFGALSNPPKEWAYFLTTGATILSLASSLFFFTTILAFFVVFQTEDNYIGGIY